MRTPNSQIRLLSPNANAIYFAGSIRGGRQDQGIYDEFTGHLKHKGLEVLCEHFTLSDGSDVGQGLTDQEIHDRDMAWIKRSRGVIGEFSNPSHGVGYEVRAAADCYLTVLALYSRGVKRNRRLSAMIGGAPNVVPFEYERTKSGITVAKVAIDVYLDDIFWGIPPRNATREKFYKKVQEQLA